MTDCPVQADCGPLPVPEMRNIGDFNFLYGGGGGGGGGGICISRLQLL